METPAERRKIAISFALFVVLGPDFCFIVGLWPSRGATQGYGECWDFLSKSDIIGGDVIDIFNLTSSWRTCREDRDLVTPNP